MAPEESARGAQRSPNTEIPTRRSETGKRRYLYRKRVLYLVSGFDLTMAVVEYWNRSP